MTPEATSPGRERRGLPALDLTPLAAALFVFLLLGMLMRIAPEARHGSGTAALRGNGQSASPGTRTFGNASAASTGQADKVIAVDASDRLYYDGREVVLEELMLELHHLAAQGGGTVRIAAHAGARFSTVTAAMDAAAEAGLAIGEIAEVQPGELIQ